MKTWILASCGACFCFGFAITINLMLSLNYKGLLSNAEGYLEPTLPAVDQAQSITLRLKRRVSNISNTPKTKGEDAYDSCGGVFEER